LSATSPIPIETQTSALRNLNTVRTISLYGLSDVKLQFTFDYTYEEALQQVLNRLSQLPPLLNGAQPQISPVSPIGRIYRYKLAGTPDHDVRELKTLQDWVLQRGSGPCGSHRCDRLGRQDQDL
jgi:cobalt-zinc-cadmium resistance protein CzcA